MSEHRPTVATSSRAAANRRVALPWNARPRWSYLDIDDAELVEGEATAAHARFGQDTGRWQEEVVDSVRSAARNLNVTTSRAVRCGASGRRPRARDTDPLSHSSV